MNKKNRSGRVYILFILFTLSLFLIAIYSMKTNLINIQEGDVLDRDIKATKDIEDVYTTELIRKESVNKVSDKYRQDPSIQLGIKNDISSFFSEVRDIRNIKDLNENSKISIILEKSPYDLNKNQIRILVGMEERNLDILESYIKDLSNNIMTKGVKEKDLEYEQEKLNGLLDHLDIEEGEKEIGYIILRASIRVNEFLDVEETKRLKDEAAESVQTLVIKENDTIAKKGSLVGKREMALFEKSGLLKYKNNSVFKDLLGTMVLIFIYIGSIGLYIYNFNREVFGGNKIIVIMIISVLVILISKTLFSISPYILPISSGIILYSILIDLRLGLYLNVFISIFLGYILKLDMNIIIMYILSGSIGGLINIRQGDRNGVFISGIVVGFINLLLIIGFGLSKNVSNMEILSRSAYGFLSGLISSIVALGTLPIWENVFEILTPLKLLELSNPNKALLKKLMMETPGTYHHSILVGNLAESAAEAIGANSLLTRVGAYYHDIGKTKNPLYFAENQFGIENPHNKLNPLDSASIILSHTKDGVTMGKKEKLPKEILALIEEHHGTTSVAYFKYKAEEAGMLVDPNDFKYDGKPPQTKEAAILMLADSSEAAVRSLKDLNEEKIENMVRKVVGGKIGESQMVQCDITFKDIEIIIDSFVNTLTGIYHDRIEYPEKKGE